MVAALLILGGRRVLRSAQIRQTNLDLGADPLDVLRRGCDLEQLVDVSFGAF